MTLNIRILASFSLVLAVTLASYGEQPTEPISFVEQVRPVLSDKCFACHGPDEKTREADLRLDMVATAIESGAIVPGQPDQSELMQRILSDDLDLRMPPEQSHKELSSNEIETIRRWIGEGAQHQQHWSYRPLVRPQVPAVDHPHNRNAIDAFILKRLSKENLELSPQADKTTLLRRLYLDLLGVPPGYSDVQRFVQDDSDDAWSLVVDRLLRDQRFGERMAVFWLDLVRYADTIGYHSDTHMEVSAYRDYVIESFNNNMPFDQFTIEQLAGDLLPEATVKQRIASGYNRLLQTTEEGGAQAKEYIAIYAADRVRNVSGVWMGQTVGCAQCHDHKYDPITTKDFYSLAAFFADIKETAVGKQKPNLTLILPEDQQQIDALEKQIADQQIDVVLETDSTLAQRVANGQLEWEMKTVAGLDADDSVPKPIIAALKTPPDDRTDEHRQQLADHYRGIAPELADARKRLADTTKQLADFRKSLRTMLVAESLPEPRMTRILPRGNWLDDTGEVVEPAVPQFLPHEEITGRRGNRLDLAKWLVADDNPLTARTFVNRLWKMFYGNGLSRDLDDLGGQGEVPTHPELLDWLSVEFLESGWDIKAIVRLMVTSGSYAQVSTASETLRAGDPGNRNLARQSTWRIEAEFVRDTALSLSGLLVDESWGGLSVKPYQPAGYWRHLNFPQRKWKAAQGDKLYRRSLYTFWCRTFPHPSMLAFDAPGREECTAQRARSNIPQQALVLLNDPIFVEASRVFAQHIVSSASTPEDRITWAFHQALSRDPSSEELELLRELLEDQQRRYGESVEDAKRLLSVGSAEVSKEIDPIELAAWTQVGRAIINIYEVTSRF